MCTQRHPTTAVTFEQRIGTVTAALKQDVEDLTALEVTKTPTFFVNGRSLPSFGAAQLESLVAEEVAKIKMPDLNANDLEAAKQQVRGTARSMGLKVK